MLGVGIGCLRHVNGGELSPTCHISWQEPVAYLHECSIFRQEICRICMAYLNTGYISKISIAYSHADRIHLQDMHGVTSCMLRIHMQGMHGVLHAGLRACLHARYACLIVDAHYLHARYAWRICRRDMHGIVHVGVTECRICMSIYLHGISACKICMSTYMHGISACNICMTYLHAGLSACRICMSIYTCRYVFANCCTGTS
jgi:hypothetical protein